MTSEPGKFPRRAAPSARIAGLQRLKVRRLGSYLTRAGSAGRGPGGRSGRLRRGLSALRVERESEFANGELAAPRAPNDGREASGCWFILTGRLSSAG